ncbi:MAG: hypothetical protein WCK86_15250 [Planctomycetia bacterium]
MTTDQGPEAHTLRLSASNGRPSHELPVKKFEVKLIWPVFLQPQRRNGQDFQDATLDPDRSDFLQNWVDAITGASESQWQETDSSFPPLVGKESGPGYAEFCYFHPFVRNFLYVNRDDVRAYYRKSSTNPPVSLDEAVKAAHNRNLRVLKRGDLDRAQLDVTFLMEPDGSRRQQLTSTFDVNSCWLYLFDTQIALVELHLEHNGTANDNNTSLPLNLRMVLKLQDIMRRMYAAYWDVFPDKRTGTTHHVDSHVPLRMMLRRNSDSSVAPVIAHYGNFQISDALMSADAARDLCHLTEPSVAPTTEQREQIHAATEQRKFAYRNREPFTNAVWQELLSPLQPLQLTVHGDSSSACALRYEHIQDDRCPLMSYLAIGEPQADVRFDRVYGIRQISQGDWQRLAGIDDEGNSQCWPFSPTFVDGDPLRGFAYDRFWHATGQVPAQDYQTTRWLCSASSFSGVGRWDERSFFNDPHAGALGHFRHHYFVLVLVALFHRASLLRYKHALSENAVEWLNAEGNRREERFDQFREKTLLLQQQLLRFRAFYWISEVSNQTQGQELFALLRRHLNLQQLYQDVCVDIENASAVLRQEAENKRQHATWTLTLLGLAFFFVNLFSNQINDFIKASPNSGNFGIAAVLLLGFGLIGVLARSSLCELLGRLTDGFCCSPDHEHVGPAVKWFRRYQDSSGFRVIPILAILLGSLLMVYSLWCSAAACIKTSPASGGHSASEPVAATVNPEPGNTLPPAATSKPAAPTPPKPADQTPASAADSSASQDSSAVSGSKESPEISAPQ